MDDEGENYARPAKKAGKVRGESLESWFLGPAFDAIMSAKLEELEKAGVVGELKEERMPLSGPNANAKRKADDSGQRGELKKARTGVQGPGGIQIIDLT